MQADAAGETPHGHGASRYDRALRGALIAVAAMTAATFLLTLFLPIYTDEVLTKLSQGRLIYDGGRNMSAYPTCGAISFAVPALLWPFRWLDTAIYEPVSHPFTLRAIGAAMAAGWICLTGLVLWRAAPHSKRREAIVVLLSLATVGVMPFLLVVNRPEQVMLFGLSLTALPLILNVQARRLPLWADLAAGAGALAAGGIVMACHPRAFLLWPLACIAIFRYINRRAIAAPVVLLLALVAVATVHNLGVRTGCTDPALQPVLVRDSLLGALGMGHLGDYVLALTATALLYPGNALFIEQFQFKNEYRSAILPPITDGWPLLLGHLTTFLFLLLLICGGIAYAKTLRAALRGGPRRTQAAALGLLWFFWGFSVIARVFKNDYEAALLMPVIAMMTLGSIWAARAELAAGMAPPEWQKLWHGFVLGIAGLSVISQATLLLQFLPSAHGSWSQPGYPAGQKFSVVGLGYDRLAPAIMATGAMCGIGTTNQTQHLIVDELTYFTYRKTYQPFLATFIDEHGWGRTITDFPAVLSHVGSQGMVVGCQWVPEALRSKEKRNGQFCCVPPSAWR
jgi:hypothetical protein